MSIIVDDEFKSLIPPLSPDEYSQLEENIVRDGIRDPLVVWHVPNGDDILIDGHNRFEISVKHAGIPFQIKRMTFDLRKDVIRWIILNQFGRRNLSSYDRSVLALKLKPVFTERAKEKQAEAGGAVRQKSDKAAIDTKKELAKIANVSHDTIHKVETIENSGNELVKQQAKSGKISINKAYNIVTDKVDKSPKQLQTEYMNEVRERHEDFETKKQESKVVSFGETIRDKDDQKEIASETWSRLMRMGRSIDTITGAISDREINLEIMVSNLEEERSEQLKVALTRWIKKLSTIYREVCT
jgi:hypothetical protein